MAGGAVAEPLHGARLGGPELLLSADARVGGARRHSNNIILYRELEEEEDLCLFSEGRFRLLGYHLFSTLILIRYGRCLIRSREA